MTDVIARADYASTELRQDGWTLMPGAVSSAAVEKIKDWLCEATNVSATTPQLEAQFEEQSALPASGSARKLRRLYWNDPGFWRDVLVTTGMAQNALAALGEGAVLTFHAAFLKTAGGGSAVPFHQDQALWAHTYPRAINMWLAIHPTTIENGCIELCTGSHRHGALPHARYDPEWVHDGVDLAAHGLVPQAVEMAAGDVLAWDRFMVHGSAANSSDRDRWGVVAVFVDGSMPDFQATDRALVKDMLA
jgi:hypothetical protein